jgi:hypothetical protein
MSVNLYIENITEKQLLKWLNDGGEGEKEVIKGDYNYFIDYLKNEWLATEYICKSTYDKAIILIEKYVNCFCLEGVNIDELYKLIKENASRVLERTSEWKTSEILLISDTAKKLKLNCSYAEFKYINKWGYNSESETYEIIYDNERIYWIRGKNNEPLYERIYWIKSKDNNSLCYVLSKDKIYGIKYVHKTISIFKFFGNILHDNAVETDAGLDEIFTKHETTVKYNKIDLENHFYKGFFYKGLLWDRNWKKEITIMKSVEFAGGRLRIEIENLTYPHSGYVFLDIENAKVLEE